MLLNTSCSLTLTTLSPAQGQRLFPLPRSGAGFDCRACARNARPSEERSLELSFSMYVMAASHSHWQGAVANDVARDLLPGPFVEGEGEGEGTGAGAGNGAREWVNLVQMQWQSSASHARFIMQHHMGTTNST